MQLFYSTAHSGPFIRQAPPRVDPPDVAGSVEPDLGAMRANRASALAQQQALRDAGAQRQTLAGGDLPNGLPAYTFLAPSYRKLVGVERYESSFGTAVAWKSVEVVGVSCEPEKCTARVKIESQPVVPTLFKGTITTHVDEEWLLEDGQWWLYQKL